MVIEDYVDFVACRLILELFKRRSYEIKNGFRTKRGELIKKKMGRISYRYESDKWLELKYVKVGFFINC